MLAEFFPGICRHARLVSRAASVAVLIAFVLLSMPRDAHALSYGFPKSWGQFPDGDESLEIHLVMPDGQPIRGAKPTIWLRAADGAFGQMLVDRSLSRRDAGWQEDTGVLEIWDVPPGDYLLDVMANDFWVCRSPIFSIVAADGSESQVFDVVMYPLNGAPPPNTGSIRGTMSPPIFGTNDYRWVALHDADAGRAWAGLTVWVSEDTVNRIVVDPHTGAFAVEHLPPGEWRFFVSLGSGGKWQSHRITVVSGATTTVHLEPTPYMPLPFFWPLLAVVLVTVAIGWWLTSRRTFAKTEAGRLPHGPAVVAWGLRFSPLIFVVWLVVGFIPLFWLIAFAVFAGIVSQPFIAVGKWLMRWQPQDRMLAQLLLSAAALISFAEFVTHGIFGQSYDPGARHLTATVALSAGQFIASNAALMILAAHPIAPGVFSAANAAAIPAWPFDAASPLKNTE